MRTLYCKNNFSLKIYTGFKCFVDLTYSILFENDGKLSHLKDDTK